ncbi:MAG TPA: PDZ domain-containing protein [Terriglobales bacterium]|nr:PDZ domain-containing protein [Terriglobales bacterium]
MKKLVVFAFAALFLPCLGAAQNLPAIDLFGGYSYFRFTQPLSDATPSQQLTMNGWEVSASVALLHHLSVEGDFAGHTVGNCGSASGVNCTDFSYMVGPRYTFGDRSKKLTPFVHALIGRDSASLLSDDPTGPNPTVSDSSVALAAGGGLDYWITRHIGVQLGPFDYFYTNHLNNAGAPSQSSVRAGGGIAFRFGGDFPPPEPKESKEEKADEGHRSWIRPWHKSKPEGQTTAGQPAETQSSSKPARKSTPATTATAAAPSHGMSIRSLGLVAAPEEFDGAKILQIEPGSIAEMASLHVGDLIKSIDGKPVKTPMELAAELSGKTGKVRIGIQRGKLATETVVILGAQ